MASPSVTRDSPDSERWPWAYRVAGTSWQTKVSRPGTYPERDLRRRGAKERLVVPQHPAQDGQPTIGREHHAK